MERIWKITFSSVLVGVLVTLVSGFLFNPFVVGDFPNIRVVSEPLMGVGYWGYLLPWLKQVVAWPIPPRTIIWQNLVIDLILWSAIPFAILTAVFRERTK